MVKCFSDPKKWESFVYTFPPSPPTGYNCQVNINECASNPCLNQGTCFDDISGYTCHCALPYTGGYHRPDVCPVLDSTSTWVPVTQVSDATLRTQCLVARGLTGYVLSFLKTWQQRNSLLYLCYLVFVGFYQFVLWCWGLVPQPSLVHPQLRVLVFGSFNYIWLEPGT